ncbi:hypothetical protein JCM8547_004245 [Rhodosporidiobolus lusitaniae]
MDPLSIAAAAAGLSLAAYLDARLRLADDLTLVKAVAGARLAMASNNRNDRNSLYYVFEKARDKREDEDCYVCDGVGLSWNQVAEESNRLAHYLLAQGLERGDTIALFMPNKLAYPIVWLACLAIDVIPAFINFNLTSAALTHCITVASPKLVLYDSSLSAPISHIASELRDKLFPGKVKMVKWSDEWTKPLSRSGEKGEGEKEKEVEVEGETVLDDKTRKQFSSDRIPDERRSGIQWSSPACLIYTSGTTGLPKAALTLHGRCVVGFRCWTAINSFDRHSRIYTPMPLYHSTALILAVGLSWHSASTVIIGRKFSATRFWEDVRESKANVVQYVGEVLRYLLATPPSHLDKQHAVRLAYGNGCRPDVWEKFRERFGVQVISEFFASSEGNGSLFNHNSNSFGAGAVGSEGALLGLFQKNKQVIVRVDPLTEEPERTKEGMCVRAEADEPGELVIRIEEGSGYQQFAGYYGNKAATEKKIIQDVLVKGDKFFRTGDLLRRSPLGHFYFHDRLGDTFRWRSENVSTTEVAEKLGEVVGEVAVYGVLVPGHDGRAGCAAIPKHAARTLDLDKLAEHVQRMLPRFAQPVFVRVVEELESTGNGKVTKVKHRTEGVDPSVVPSTPDFPIYWLEYSGGKGRYKVLTEGDWKRIGEGKARL